MRRIQAIRWACVVGCAVVSWGCGGASKAPAYARPYPVYLEQRATLDIQVQQRPRTLTLTNTSAQRFGPSTIWLNKRFARPIGSLGVGESLTLDLSSFSDEFGERFRGGGFFAVREPERLVLAQVETTGFVDEAGRVSLTGGDAGETVLIGLVVVNANEEDLR